MLNDRTGLGAYNDPPRRHEALAVCQPDGVGGTRFQPLRAVSGGFSRQTRAIISFRFMLTFRPMLASCTFHSSPLL